MNKLLLFALICSFSFYSFSVEFDEEGQRELLRILNERGICSNDAVANVCIANRNLACACPRCRDSVNKIEIANNEN